MDMLLSFVAKAFSVFATARLSNHVVADSVAETPEEGEDDGDRGTS
eukprot:CAMPEP_0177283156 /NCGR_PEP_ID=MMETSP0367-20130122/71854_1 /TAXON_ID=447022 ORGANISM="Scrippsiella hangoei-like, Strain SHHI-4" /NCGR_SAMPLE_ID=MMETSP0367 /ASSEMBLY_ACC=CAM_ASM_000362 /LENGTH=45 /DNA_ID= /DNA_START= /DNA_END= /DNA_ORIENTATION=